MFKSSSRFSLYAGPIFIIFASLTLMGCPKKVSSVSGSSGVTNDGRTSADSSSPSRDSTSRGDSSGDIRQDEIASTRRGDSSSRGGDSSSDGRSRDFDGQSGAERRGMSDERLSFNQNVYFDYDRSIVRQDAKDLLQNNARWMALNSGTKIRIEGHGDERGTNDYNLALGERRARSIVRYLVNLGIRESRFTFISFGEERSVCKEKSEDCYQKNRRVHFLVKN